MAFLHLFLVHNGFNKEMLRNAIFVSDYQKNATRTALKTQFSWN